MCFSNKQKQFADNRAAKFRLSKSGSPQAEVVGLVHDVDQQAALCYRVPSHLSHLPVESRIHQV